MKDKVYLGIWFQRTSLHLREIYNFLNEKKGVENLDSKKLNELWKNTKISNVKYLQVFSEDQLKANSDDISISITEDGIILLSTHLSENAVKNLENYYSKSLGPALNYLFSRGAPIPKDLTIIKETYPIYYAVYGLTKEECFNFFKSQDEKILYIMKNKFADIYTGEKIEIFNCKKTEYVDEDLMLNLIFLREFERQLKYYLDFHRSLWDRISAIRDSNHVHYKELAKIRENLLDYMKTLSFIKARLFQMRDILNSRQLLLNQTTKKKLSTLSLLDRFEMHKSNNDYIIHLWEMTQDYANSTITLLETLYSENTQKELNALRFISIMGVLTGFFGMNIAFPWEERWPDIFSSSIFVVGIIITFSFLFYSLLKFLIYKRKFKISN